MESLVIYHNTKEHKEKEYKEAKYSEETSKPSSMFYNQRCLYQTSLLEIHSVKVFAPKEWINNSNKIGHPFTKNRNHQKRSYPTSSCTSQSIV